MDLDNINKNILCLLGMVLVFIIALSTNSRVSAVTRLPNNWQDNENLYSFKLEFPTQDFNVYDKEVTLERRISSIPDVVGGNYYYFYCRSYIHDWDDFIFLVKKSSVNSNFLNIVYDNAQNNFFLELFQNNVLPYVTDAYSKNQFTTDDIKFSYTNSFDKLGFINNDSKWHKFWNTHGWLGIPIQVRQDGESPNFIIKTYLKTNYTGDIIYTDKNQQKHFLTFNSPFIINDSQDLASLSSENLSISAGTYATKDIYLKLYNNTVNSEIFNINIKNVYKNCFVEDMQDYFDPEKTVFGYNIPFSKLPKFQYITGNSYTWSLEFGENSVYSVTIIADIDGYFGVDSLSDNQNQELLDNQNKNTEKLLESNKETQNKLDEQTQALKENNETNKNIFQKIGDILSFINPFSENFFGRKLVELIIEGLKSLFVPAEGFFDNYFSEIRQWFSDRLGFLWTPFDFVIEVLNRILNINFSEPVIHIPEIKAPFVENQVLISEMDYNLNSLKDNETFANIHNLYLAGVDFIIIVALINLARKKIEEVFEN